MVRSSQARAAPSERTRCVYRSVALISGQTAVRTMDIRTHATATHPTSRAQRVSGYRGTVGPVGGASALGWRRGARPCAAAACLLSRNLEVSSSWLSPPIAHPSRGSSVRAGRSRAVGGTQPARIATRATIHGYPQREDRSTLLSSTRHATPLVCGGRIPCASYPDSRHPRRARHRYTQRDEPIVPHIWGDTSLFALPAVAGPLPNTIRRSYGWHA